MSSSIVKTDSAIECMTSSYSLRMRMTWRHTEGRQEARKRDDILSRKKSE